MGIAGTLFDIPVVPVTKLDKAYKAVDWLGVTHQGAHMNREVVVDDFEIAGKLGREFLREGADAGIEVDGRRVLERGVLGLGGGDDVWVAVADADGHDAAETIEVAAPGVVPDILHVSLYDHERLAVIEEEAGVEELLALREHLRGGRAGVDLRAVRRGGQRDGFHRWRSGVVALLGRMDGKAKRGVRCKNRRDEANQGDERLCLEQR